MLHGKKGFDRIVYAFKNVLTTPVTWLFHDLGTAGKFVLPYFDYGLTALQAPTPDPLDKHAPVRRTVPIQITQDIKVKMPSLKPPTDIDPMYGNDFEDYAVEINEWLCMVLLESPRLHPEDHIDPQISRYQPPGDVTEQKLAKVTLQGFYSPLWAHQMFVNLLLALPKGAWFAYSVTSLAEGWQDGGKSSMILKLPDDSTNYVLWDIA